MNKVIMLGRLVRDPEVRRAMSDDKTIARFSIAVPRRFKREGEPEADFFNCVAFGKTGDFIEKYFTQGKQIAITGRVENDNYTNKDGQKVYGTRILVEECDFCGSAGESATSTEKTQNTANTSARKESDGFMNIPDGIDEELPFN